MTQKLLIPLATLIHWLICTEPYPPTEKGPSPESFHFRSHLHLQQRQPQ